MFSLLAGSFLRSGIIVLLIFLAYFSAKWMVADFYGERVALSIDSWRGEAAKNTSHEILEEHLDFILEAQKWAPENARYKELEARLRLLRIMHLQSSQIQSELETIAGLHREAIKLRPLWPFSWANLAYMKGLQRDYDEEFDLALKKFMQYGSFESSALRRISYTGIKGWNRLSLESKSGIMLAITNAAELDRRLARDLRGRLEQAELNNTFCSQAEFHSQKGYDRICG